MQTIEQKTGKRQTHGQKYKKKLQDWQIGMREKAGGQTQKR